MKKKIKAIIRTLLGKRKADRQKKAKPHDFIKWLKFANAGMLNNGNLYCLEYAIENLPSDNPVIEIGSFCGLSTNLISFYLRQNNRKNKLITADKWIFEGARDLEGGLITNDEYRTLVKESYIRNISLFSKDRLPYTVEQLSDDFFQLWQLNRNENDILGRPVQLGGPISFAYIDGNHSMNLPKGILKTWTNI